MRSKIVLLIVVEVYLGVHSDYVYFIIIFYAFVSSIF